MKKYVESALTGMGFGFPITIFFMILFGGFNELLRQLLVWMAASACYGMLPTLIYRGKSFEEAMLPISLGLHVLGCGAITVAAALLNGYIKGVVDLIPVLIPALIVYFLIFGICFWMMKKDEKAINRALEEK